MNERLYRALQIVENASPLAGHNIIDAENNESSSKTKINRRKVGGQSLERVRQECLEIRQILASWESPNSTEQVQRHELGRAIGALFQLLDHREQSLRFVADQALDAILRKFVLRLQPPKVIAFLLTELNKKQASARSLCAILQKLPWVIGHTKAQRASIYISHFLVAIDQCLQRSEESIQLAVERQFPACLAHFGPYIGTAHAEKSTQLFATAMANLDSGGSKNRAASTVIAHLAKFVPSILHKSFYQLKRIIVEANEKEKVRLASALNTFRLIWPTILDSLTESSVPNIQKMLSKVLCCLYANPKTSGEILVASLEFLQKVAHSGSEQQQQNEIVQQLGQFRPLQLQRMQLSISHCGSPVQSIEDSRREGSWPRSGDDKLTEVDTISLLSMRTGYSSSRMMSAWSSLNDLAAINQIFGKNDEDAEEEDADLEMDDHPPNEEEDAETENESDNNDEDDDKYSVISAELFVDPLMNCFHQQQKAVAEKKAGTFTANYDDEEGEEETSRQQQQQLLDTPKFKRIGTMGSGGGSGSMTPNSTISRSGGRGRQGTGASQISRTTLAAQTQEGEEKTTTTHGILDNLPEHFCNSDLNFWAYSALTVARQFLLAPRGKTIRPDRDVRVSHKILAIDFIASIALREAGLFQQPIFDDVGGHQFLTNIFSLVGHEDDNLAIAALGLAMNAAKMEFFKNPSVYFENSRDKSKLIWLLKKVLHPQYRNPMRLKSLMQVFATNSLFLAIGDDQLLSIACEQAILAATNCDYFLTKTMSADFLSRIQWSRVSTETRRLLQSECLDVFLRQLFDSDHRVQRATLEALPTLVRNADFGRQTALFNPSFSLPQSLDGNYGGVGEANSNNNNNNKIPILLGLDIAHYPFCVQPQPIDRRIQAENLAHCIGQIYGIGMEKFAERQTAFLAAISTLMEYFPANSGGGFASTWMMTRQIGDGIGTKAMEFGKAIGRMSSLSGSNVAVQLPLGHNLLALVLECTNECKTLDKLAIQLKLISHIFTAISESLIMENHSDSVGKFVSPNRNGSNDQKHNPPPPSSSSPQNASLSPNFSSPSAIPSLWGFPRHNLDDPTTFNNYVEQCLLLHLRILNLYYSIGAEERLQQQQRDREHQQRSATKTAAAMALAGTGESLMSGAAAILANPTSLLIPREKKESASGNNNSSSSSNSNKAANLSFLVGTGVKQFRPTSYTHSQTLKAMECPLRGAYKSFIECLDPTAHQRFLEPFESLLHSFSALLEMADFCFIRPFLDELLIYLRMLMDISYANSARLIHQLLKCLFNVNAQNLNGRELRPSEIWHQHSIYSGDPYEMYLLHPLNMFTVFSTFVGRPEFTESLVQNVGGWLLRHKQMPQIDDGEQQQQMNHFLHQFEPFITHLLKLYPLINSLESRKSILECITTLCLCNVRYELLDRNGKFQARLLSQLRQLSPSEDGPLLGPIFAFLCVLARIQSMKFAEVEKLLTDLFARLDAQNFVFIIEAAKVVLLDVIASGEEPKMKKPKPILMAIKELLCKEFQMAFQLAPEESAEIWIILLHAMRKSSIENWFELCSDFFANFIKSCLLLNSTGLHHHHHRHSLSPQSPPPFSSQSANGPMAFVPAKPNPIRQIFLQTILLSQCSLTVPIHSLLESLQILVSKYSETINPQWNGILSNFERDQLEDAIGQLLGPILFVLISQIEEESMLARRMATNESPAAEDEQQDGMKEEEANDDIRKEEAEAIEEEKEAQIIEDEEDNKVIDADGKEEASAITKVEATGDGNAEAFDADGKDDEETNAKIVDQMKEDDKVIEDDEKAEGSNSDIKKEETEAADETEETNKLIGDTQVKEEAVDEDDHGNEETIDKFEEDKQREEQEQITLLHFIGRSFASLLKNLLKKTCPSAEGNNYYCPHLMSNNAKSNESSTSSTTTTTSNSSREAICQFLLFTANHSIRSGKYPKFSSILKSELSLDNELLANTIIPLAICSPANWAHFCQLIFSLYPKGAINLCTNFNALPSHWKQLLAGMFIANSLSDKDEKSQSSRHMELPTSREHFYLELLKIGDGKMLKKLINKMDEKSLEIMKKELTGIFSNANHTMDGLLPRFSWILAKLEPDLMMGRIAELDGPRSAETVQIIRAHLQQKPEPKFARPNPKFSAKELAKLNESGLTDAQFYGTLAGHSSQPMEFRQICIGIIGLEQSEIAQILQILPSWPFRREFYYSLFGILRENVRIGFGQNDGTNAKQFLSTILHCLAEIVFIQNDDGNKICAEEKIFVMAQIVEMMEEGLIEEFHWNEAEKLLQYHPNSGNKIEAILNAPFVRNLLVHIQTGTELPMDYFKALKLFFLLDPVKEYFCEDDCQTIGSLFQFLTALWDQIENDIPHWHRLNIDKRHWSVQIIAAGVGGNGKTAEEEEGELGNEEMREQIHKMFKLVQRMVFALQKNLVEEKGIREALQSILAGVSVLQRMALVPEVALRSNWTLTIEVDAAEGQIQIPLVQIHMLNEPTVLEDFYWRALWLGWSSRAQFEEFCMSLYGVLSSTPISPQELQQRAADSDGGNSAVQQQLLASSLAIEALCSLLLQTLLYPQPGMPICSHFLVKHRKRAENYIFLGTDYGKLALRAKALTNGMTGIGISSGNSNEFYTENVESTWECRCHYGIGQTSLYYLWSITGLLETSQTPTKSIEMKVAFRQSTSEYLIAQSKELDTASSVRAIFETFMHWLHSSNPSSGDNHHLAASFSFIPRPILHSTLRSLALLSDLFHEPALFKQTYATIKNLVANQSLLDEHDPCSKGYAIVLLLKCASVLDWAELADNGEVSIAKFIESLVQNGLHNGQSSQWVRICTLHGLLYALQSVAVEHLQRPMAITMEFVLKELRRMQQKLMSDILTECPTDLVDYQRLCWAFCFTLLQEAIPIEEVLREQFLQMAANSFVDPRSPEWLKLVLTRGIESLVLHSCSYAPRFRRMALECFETYQLQPGHLPFALSIFATCAYREVQEGGEYAYIFNKTFLEDFQKLLNIFSFYTTNPMSHQQPNSHSIIELVSDLVSTIWAKEAVFECLWTMLMPPTQMPTSPKNMQSPIKSLANRTDEATAKISADFAHPLEEPATFSDGGNLPKDGMNEGNNECHSSANSSMGPIVPPPQLLPIHLQLSPFDQSLLHLVHLIFKKLFIVERRVAMELALNSVLPKLERAGNAKMAQCLTLVLLCSTNPMENVQKRVHFLFQSDPFGSNFFKVAFPSNGGHFMQQLVDAFISQVDCLQMAEPEKLGQIRKSLNALMNSH